MAFKDIPPGFEPVSDIPPGFEPVAAPIAGSATADVPPGFKPIGTMTPEAPYELPGDGEFSRFVPTAPTQPDTPEGNFVSDLLPQLGERTAQMAGGLLQTVATTIDPVGDWLQQNVGDLVEEEDGSIVWRRLTPEETALPSGPQMLAKRLRETDLGYEQRTSWDDVKSDPLPNVVPFVGEQLVNSIPDMAALLSAPVPYVVARTGELGSERAENQGRQFPTTEDLAVTSPVAAVSSAIDRVALGKTLGLGEAPITSGKQLAKEAGKSVVREGSTEVVQENLEYAGTNLGTQEGYDIGEALDRTGAAAVAGGAIGGGLRGATGAVELARAPRQPQTQTQPPSPAADPSRDRVNTVELETPAPVETEQVVTPAEQVPDVEPVAPASEQAPPASTEVTPENNPRRAKVYTPDNEEVEVEYQVLDADQVLTSDQAGFDQNAQPRDRSGTNKNSEAQIESIANAPNFDRLYRAPETDRGAPVIGADNLVESGNGRVMGLRRAYERGTADAYRQRVVSEFPEAANMAKPIIVARRVTDVDRTDFAYRSNTPATMQMSAVEMATAEARMIDDQVVSLYRGGDILDVKNRDMVRAFIGKLPKSQQNGLITPDGQGLTVDGQRRFEAAIFQRAYGDRELLARVASSTDNDMRSVANALRTAAPLLARLQNAIDRGEVNPDAGLASALSEAMTKLADIRAKGTNLRAARAQAEAFETPLSPVADAILNAFYNPEGTRLASRDDMVEFLEDFADNAMKSRIDQANLPNVEPAPTKNAEQLANEALARQRTRSAANEPATLFEPASSAVGRGESGPRRAAQGQRQDGGARAEGTRDAGPDTGADLDGVTDEDLFSDIDPDFEENFAGDMMADAVSDRTPRGSFAPKFDEASRSNKRSIYEQAYKDAGLSPDEGVNLPPAQRRAVLSRMLESVFGFKVRFGPGAQTIEAVNSMLDGYQNIRMMLSVLQLPLDAISLGGNLTVSLDKQNNRYLGAYDPATKTIHMPGRSNSFAHEWMHALDDYLLAKLKPGMAGRLLSQVTRNDGLDPNNPLEASFINLVNRMFFDKADLALKMLQLEAEASKVVTKGPRAGQPTAEAIKAQEQLDRLNAGATRIRSISPTAYRAGSKAYGQATSGDAGAQYYGSVHEMMARAFEAFIAHKVKLAGGTNEFITKGDDAYLDTADARLASTYPKTGERLEIFSAFEDLFGELRASATLGSGPATPTPDTTDVYDPSRYLRESMADKDPNVFKGMVEEYRKTRNIARGAVSAGFVKSLKSGVANLAGRGGYSPDESYLRNIRMMGKLFFGTMRGMTKFLIASNQNKGGEFIQFIADRFMTDPGTGRSTDGATWEESRDRFTATTAARINTALLRNGFGETLAAADNSIVQAIMWGNNPTSATAQHKAVAAELRRIMEEGVFTAKDAKLDMGYVENKGYLPRVVLASAVEQDLQGFVKGATEVYELKFDADTQNMSPEDVMQFAAGVARANDNTLWQSTDKNNVHPYRPLIAKMRAIMRRMKQGANNPNYDPTNDQAQLDQAKQDLLDAVRPDYASFAAEDWKRRILIGDSFTYDSHGPASNFMKSRTLPPEADEILKDFYESDVLNLTINYASKVKSKAEFQKRAGATGGNTQLKQVIARQNVAKAINANPSKYNEKTAAGRMAILRDLTDISQDNLIELSISEALRAGANANDLTQFRAIMEQITGQRTGGAGERLSNMTANFLYAYAMLRLLSRTALTSLTEPMSVMFQTGDFVLALKTMKTYFGELAGVLAGQSDTIAERAALARAIGLIAEPLYDGVLANRLSGDFNGDRVGSTSLPVTNFMRANLLTGLTNIQRRVAMNAGFVWFNDLANRWKDPNTSDYQRKVYEAEFRDLGIPDKHMAAMMDWLSQKDTLPTLSDLNTPAGKIFADAVARFSDRVITNPRKADKPIYAGTPVGRVVYTLTSFLYTFFRNVHLATINRTKRNYNIARDLGSSRSGAAASAVFGPNGPMWNFVLGFTMMGVAQMIVTMGREALFNHEQWEEKEDERFGWLFRLALTRTGIFGPADIAVNSVTSLKYERDLTSLAAGVSPTIILGDVANLLKWAANVKNSPNTNTTERTAAKSAYNLAMAPAAAWVLSSMTPQGPAGWAARYAALVAATSPNAASGFADVVAGEQTKR